jgi:hypothetical protein
MSSAGVLCLIAGIVPILAAVSGLGVRLFARRMNIWADQMICCFFGSPEELLRRLQEGETPKTQPESGKGSSGNLPPLFPLSSGGSKVVSFPL